MKLLNAERARGYMTDLGLDALVATTVENLAYFAEFTARTLHGWKDSLAFAVLPREDLAAATLLLPIVNAPEALDRPSWIKDVRFYGSFGIALPDGTARGFDRALAEVVKEPGQYANGVEALVSLVKERGWRKIGIDEMRISPVVWQQVADGLTGVELVPAYDTIKRIRTVKTPEEIDRLHRSVTIAEAGIKRSMDCARVGMTEADLLDTYLETIGREGAVPGCFYVNAGTRSGAALLASSPDYILKPGDCLKYDVGCVKDFYWSDTARTAVMGRPSAKLTLYYNAMREGQQALIEAIRPGVKASALFDLAVNTIRKAGIPHFQRPHCGHGIGLEFYDHPSIRPAATPALDPAIEEGMVINIECPYYEIGFAGIQLEDTIVVTGTGVRYLTRLDRDMREL
ncbi:MAG: Xaa-Pro peptidase family protein [bacterium]|nr:Xaa-Pro peptidase family protein [bacterium]